MTKVRHPETCPDLSTLARRMRDYLKDEEYLLLFAHNGTGKTRLSMEFKNVGRQGDERDTLYFNAFTEDLFTWENDLDADTDRHLRLNTSSRFFAGLGEFEMETRIRALLARYADFDFSLDTELWTIRFSRTISGKIIENIKISRGEENLFIWCFFLVVVELALDGNKVYDWVKYIYIDDPISSLDEHNAIAVANHLAQRFTTGEHTIKAVISTHHALFFNVLHNELKRPLAYVLSKASDDEGFHLHRETSDTPFFHHVVALVELYRALHEDRLFTFHFNTLRGILEKTATFHGYKNFGACIKRGSDDPDGTLHARLLNVLSHGKYSMFDPRVMQQENKRYFATILNDFIAQYAFNQDLFDGIRNEGAQPHD